ncbi:hypothetical protein [Bradyrhizobium sp. CCBAU 11386]|uniref:hypothetical protein n=1 Tax=Bradyrhizobium sp. CCBAU 11386 TaxID=1630837 RepID=UPI002302A21D|nr:hypothetical protein [Bradyrhizobium sp. CCBAU 11386]
MIAELPKKAQAPAACLRAAAWAAWTSDPASQGGDFQEMQNPGSDAGVFVWAGGSVRWPSQRS